MKNVNHILCGTLDEALRVDLEQRPANVAYVVLNGFKIGGFLWRVTVDGRFGQWRFSRRDFTLLNWMESASVTASRWAFITAYLLGWGVARTLFQQVAKLNEIEIFDESESTLFAFELMNHLRLYFSHKS